MSGIIENENRKKLKEHVKEIEKTVKTLEENIKDSESTDNQVVMSLQTDKIKYQGINSQLEEALKENQQLLNILQQKGSEQDLARPSSQGDVTRSCSTMSLVHLQYKYEELVANHTGLLKLLDMKSQEIKKVYDENVQLKTEIEDLKLKLSESDQKFCTLRSKYFRLKNKKDTKIEALKVKKETLQMAHNQLVGVLHNQCLEKDSVISEEIRRCGNSEKALLLQEIRKNNILSYENFQLSQKLDFLKSVLQVNNKHNKHQKS